MKKSNKGMIYLIIFLIVIIIVLIGANIYIYNNYKTSENNIEQNNKTENCIDNSTTAEKLIIDTEKDVSKGYTYKLFADGVYYDVILDSNKQISININWNLIKEKIDSSITKQNIEEVKVSDFDQEISDIFIGGVGNDISSELIILLMKDGTLEYIKIWDYISTNTATITHKKINGITEVIKLYYASEDFELNSGVGGGMTVLAQKADGNYYNLSQYIR